MPVKINPVTPMMSKMPLGAAIQQFSNPNVSVMQAAANLKGLAGAYGNTKK